MATRKSPLTRRTSKRPTRGRKRVAKKARSNQEEEEGNEEDGKKRTKGGFRQREKRPVAPATPHGLSASSSSSGAEDEFDLLMKDVVF